MAALTELDQVKISTEAADAFADSYYTALNAARHTLNGFYVPAAGNDPERAVPRINYNGELFFDATKFQAEFERHEFVFYEPQSVNAHVLNKNLGLNEAKTRKDAERNMSLAVQVSGYVRLEQRKDGPMRAFSDSFILIPNVEAAGGAGLGKQDTGRRWLIRSQNSRFVV